MGLSQVLQLIQNKVHPSARGGVPITPTVKTFNREATGVEDVGGDILPYMMDTEAVTATDPVRPRMPMVARNAPTMNNSGSQELMRQAQAILAGFGNDPRPQIQAPSNESIALALLPALLGAGTGYISKLGQGYVQGQNQELALIEQERRRREQNLIRQAQAVQGQADDLAARENLLFSQENQNFRNDQDNARMRWNTETVQDALDRRFGQSDQTRRDIAEGQQGIQQGRLELDRERIEVGNAAKLWAIALKEANMDGQVTESDVARLDALRKKIGGEKYSSRLAIPPIGSSWAKIKNDADMVYKQLVLAETQRRNRANESVAGQRASTSQQNADTGARRLEGQLTGEIGGKGGTKLPGKLGGDAGGRSAKSLRSSIQTLQAKINGEKAGQSKMGDMKQRAMAEIRIQNLAAQRDYLQAELDNLGKTPPFNPGGPNTNEAKAAAEKARQDAAKARPSGAGIPLSESNAAGGNGRQRTQAEIDAEKRLGPPAPPKKDSEGFIQGDNSRFKKRTR